MAVLQVVLLSVAFPTFPGSNPETFGEVQQFPVEPGTKSATGCPPDHNMKMATRSWPHWWEAGPRFAVLFLVQSHSMEVLMEKKTSINGEKCPRLIIFSHQNSSTRCVQPAIFTSLRDGNRPHRIVLFYCHCSLLLPSLRDKNPCAAATVWTMLFSHLRDRS